MPAATPHALTISPIADLDGVYRIAGETVGYLIVRGPTSVLIDCPAGDVAGLIRDAELPLPFTVLHTQVQAEHCHEHESFPEAEVLVAASARDVALRSTAYELECQTFWPPSREWDNRGEEAYGVAGCRTERPPPVPLNLGVSLNPGRHWRWGEITMRILELPGHGKRSIGLWWQDAGVLFSGDLMQAGGYLVNFYDVERAYGTPKGYAELRQSLDTALSLGADRWLPTTGDPITAPAADAQALLDRIAWVSQPPVRRAGEPAAIANVAPIREFGRYREILPGLYQNTNFGNVVLLVRPDGAALMVDPDFCVWESWEENVEQWHADLDLLQRETGMTRVEQVLITHYHGDHVQYVGEMRARYGSTVIATPDVAAVCERPADFGYPCTIDWYNFPFDHVPIDQRIPYEQPHHWHDLAITPIHTPGHCYAHASFHLTWAGQRILIAGDVIQYGAGPIATALPIMYNDNAWPDRGNMAAYAHIARHPVTYILGGHSHLCHDPDGAILADMQATAADSLALARQMIAHGDTLRAMTPPHFDAIRPAQQPPD